MSLRRECWPSFGLFGLAKGLDGICRIRMEWCLEQGKQDAPLAVRACGQGDLDASKLQHVAPVGDQWW